MKVSFFTTDNVHPCNSLHQDVLEFPSVELLKQSLNEHLSQMEYKTFFHQIGVEQKSCTAFSNYSSLGFYDNHQNQK
jgi:hypothetical protein